LTPILLAAAALLPAAARADTFRCGQYVISEGLRASVIEGRCGKPQSVERQSEPVMARRANGGTYQVGTATREIWVYTRSPGQFPARLTIEGGVAKKIELVTER
jgi:hypothetical protein